MLTAWSVSHRIALGFGITFILLGVIAAISNIANQQIAQTFDSYKKTAYQTLFVNEVFGRLSAAESAIIAFRAEPNQEKARAAYASLEAVVDAKDHIHEAFDRNSLEARNLATLIDNTQEYRSLFEKIERDQTKIDAYREALRIRTADIRRSYNGLGFIATINANPGAISDATRSKDAFLDSRYATGLFLASREGTAIEAAKQQLNEARSKLDSLAARAEGEIKSRTVDLIGQLDEQFVLVQKIQESVTTQGATNKRALEQVGPSLRADFEMALNDVISTQHDLGLKGNETIGQTSSLVTILAAVSILFGSGLAWIIGKWISDSVRDVANKMTELSNDNLDIKISGGEYAHEFGAMARALEIFRKNALQLKKALEAEHELNGLQRQFVSMVCHEFRTPLAIIDGNAQRIIKRQDTMSADRIKSGLGKVRTSVTRLTELMESVLNASKLEAGAIKMDPTPCDLAEIIKEVTINYREVNPSYKITTDIEDLPKRFTLDVKLIRQVVSNLLSNAIKYSPNCAHVRVDARSCDNGGVEICVVDQGVGIPADELEKMFQRFFRASTSTGIAGTGIGLHMVKSLIDMHEGTISISSEVGVGTTITVYLPRRDYQNRSDQIDAEAEAA